jgi:hypothetical protein
MALSGTLPILWGLATGRIDDAVWITLTAEAISWVEMKGSFAWRVRTLLVGSLLAIFFAILGTITGNSILLSVLCMFGVGFVSTLLKNIGDRASNLALCVYLLFIICNAFPATEFNEIKHRFLLITIGAAWPVFVGIAASVIMPAEEPFRRQIALIWRSISALVETVSKSGTDTNIREVTGELYARENDVRTAINNSFEFYGNTADEVNVKDHQQYQLVQLRKNAGLVAINVIAIGEEMAHVTVADLSETYRVKAAALLSALKEAVSRISIFIVTLNPEEKLLAVSHINRLKKLTAQISLYPLPEGEKQTIAIQRILQLTGRTIKLLESAIQRIEHMGTDVPVYRSYSFVKTLFILKPKYFLGSLRVLFNLNSFTTRYALRSAIAATAALFIYKWFNIDHGYWLPFTVMIVIQPYFGATFTRAFERVGGTLLGGLAGSLLLHLPTGLHIKEGILFLTFILMVYYIRKRYAIAAFIITLNLVLLFNLQAAYNDMLMVTRALCTIGGALFAVISGFALLPTWDKKWLPSHLAEAIKSNYEYFIATFYSHAPVTNWTKYKRSVESRNSNVFDSFNRYMQEPGKEKSEVYYDLVTYNVRITRDLNNIHLEQEEKRADRNTNATDTQQARINHAYHLFNTVLKDLQKLDDLKPKVMVYESTALAPFQLNDAQMIALEKLIIELKAMHEDLDELHL